MQQQVGGRRRLSRQGLEVASWLLHPPKWLSDTRGRCVKHGGRCGIPSGTLKAPPPPPAQGLCTRGENKCSKPCFALPSSCTCAHVAVQPATAPGVGVHADGARSVPGCMQAALECLWRAHVRIRSAHSWQCCELAKASQSLSCYCSRLCWVGTSSTCSCSYRCSQHRVTMLPGPCHGTLPTVVD